MYKKVVSNKNVGGVEGITVEELDYLKESKDRRLNKIRKEDMKYNLWKEFEYQKEIYRQ